MLRKLTIACLLLLAVNAYAHGNLKFVNGRWYDGAAFREKTMYSVGNVFRASFDGEARVIDLGGRYVVPPFADAHNHVLADGSRVDDELARYLQAGIFYVKNPNNSAARAAAARARMNTPETVDVLYANGGLTSTGGHPSQIYARFGSDFADAWHAADTLEALDALWPKIRAGKPDFIKIYLEGSRGLSNEVARAAVKKAHADGLTVAAHVTSAADFHNAVETGVDEITHLPLAPIDPADAAAAARRGITVVTTTLSHRPAPGVADVQALHRANLTVLRKAGVRVLLGVDDGNPTVIDEAENIVRLGVYSAAEVLRMLVETTPRAMFPNRRIGRLEDGAEASLIALDGNPLEDLRALRRVAVRVKQGHVIEVAPEKRPVTEAMVPLLMAGKLEAALAEYHRLLSEEADKWDFSERQLNQLGYAMLQHNQIPGAIAIFRLNSERFPKSSNVWDSLGEAYMKNGEREKAIENYRQALELDPKNENAKKMLETLRGSG
jgi:imidazolonepropionase-like amidohydrolase